MTVKQSKCLTDSLITDLSRKGVVSDSILRLAAEDNVRLYEKFEKRIVPVLTPRAVDPTHPLPYMSGGLIAR